MFKILTQVIIIIVVYTYSVSRLSEICLCYGARGGGVSNDGNGILQKIRNLNLSRIKISTR